MRSLTASLRLHKMSGKFLPKSKTCPKGSRMPENSPNNFAGIEVALATMRGVLLSAGGEVIARRESPYEPESLIPAVADLTTTLRESGDIKSVGVAIPGLVNRETDRVLISTG